MAALEDWIVSIVATGAVYALVHYLYRDVFASHREQQKMRADIWKERR